MSFPTLTPILILLQTYHVHLSNEDDKNDPSYEDILKSCNSISEQYLKLK